MEDTVKKIPTITAFLLTAGFVNSYGYYTHFQIDIFTYLTSGELILSFLPVIIPLFIAILWILFYSFRQVDKEEKIKENPFFSDKDLTLWGPFKDLVKLVKNRFKTNDKWGKILYHYLVQILARIIILTLFFGVTYFYLAAFIEKQGFPSEQPVSFFFLTVIWLIIFASHIQKYFNKRIPEISDFMTQSVIIIGFLGIIFLFNSYRAFKTLENKPLYEFEIAQDNLKIKSDSNIVYVGKTKEYYFLRNLKEDKNIIIDNKNIDIVYFKPINRKK